MSDKLCQIEVECVKFTRAILRIIEKMSESEEREAKNDIADALATSLSKIIDNLEYSQPNCYIFTNRIHKMVNSLLNAEYNRYQDSMKQMILIEET